MNQSRAQPVDRAALTEAIETKVHTLPTAALVKLAEELRVSIPGKLRRTGARPTPPTETVEPLNAENAFDVLKGRGLGSVVSAAAGVKLLEPHTVDDEAVDWADSDLLGAGDLSKRLGFARSTIDNWRRERQILAFRKGVRNYVYPLRQFNRSGPVAGLREVADEFCSAEEAWEWLVASNAIFGGQAPVDLLHAGRSEAVLTAAKGALDYA